MEVKTRTVFSLVFIIILILGMFGFYVYSNPTKKIASSTTLSPNYVCSHLQSPDGQIYSELNDELHRLLTVNNDSAAIAYDTGTAQQWIVSTSGEVKAINCELNLNLAQRLNNSDLLWSPLRDPYLEIHPVNYTQWYQGVGAWN